MGRIFLSKWSTGWYNIAVMPPLLIRVMQVTTNPNEYRD